MRRIKRLANLGSSAVVAFSSLLTVGFTGVTHAATGNLYWCGGSGSSLSFSTAANWNTNSDCSSGTQQAPSGGEDLVFDATGLTSDTSIDVSSNISVASITFSGSNTSFYNFTLKGTGVLTVTSSLSTTGSVGGQIQNDITLGGNATFNSGSSFLVLGGGSSTQTTTLGSFNLTDNGVDLDAVAGTGDINVPTNQNASINSASSSWSGNLNIAADATMDLETVGAAGTGAITVADTGSLILCGFNGGTLPNSLSVGGSGQSYTVDGTTYHTGALRVYGSCGSGGGSTFDAQGNAVLSGSVTLTSNTTVSGRSALKVTGPLSGSYTLTEEPGVAGYVDIESSNNQSSTPNGQQNSAIVTTTLSDSQPSNDIVVSPNNVVIVDGTRGNVTVESGGVLKGTGTLGTLTVNADGTVAPGHSPGCLSSGNLTENGTYQAEIGGTDACTGYDQLKVTGTVDVTNGTLNVSRYNDFKDFKKGQTFTIIDNDGSDAVTGTFSGLAEGATFKLDNGTVLGVSYKGGDGNDVVLTVQSVPTTPDTGFGMVAAHPGATLAVTVLAAGAIYGIAQKNRKLSARR